jgi:hypothetical protein
MKIRNTILALAVAALGVGTLMSTSADAGGFGGGGHGGGFGRRGGFHGGMGHGMHRGGGLRVSTNFHRRPHIHRPHWRPHRPHFHVRWHRPWIYGVGVTTVAAPAYATAKPCTCLTKEYTQDNLVVFKDLCTKESAAAPLGGPQQQTEVQQPQQAPIR